MDVYGQEPGVPMEEPHIDADTLMTHISASLSTMKTKTMDGCIKLCEGRGCEECAERLRAFRRMVKQEDSGE